MKPCEACLIGFLVSCCVAMTGCKATVYKSSSIPPLQVGSPLKGVPARTFVLKEFRDTRGVEPQLVFQAGGSKCIMDLPVATIVRTAISKELERNGHVCQSGEGQQTADFTIEGTVYKYWLNFSGGALAMKATHTANVGVKLTVAGAGSHQGLLTKNYEGSALFTSHQFSPGEFKQGFEPLMNKALLNMLEELTYDQQFIDTIQK
jgi:hypothetical protein